ncbi:MAG: T9SS type A sorting domain-containing protein [Candidatus Cloacimonetes bacterium]|nr:T9SS type A sorting domain-containing protein [Candidatus Cloacimonadota bacterium]
MKTQKVNVQIMFKKVFILVTFISIGLLVFANFLYSQEETIKFEIVDFDTLNGYPGFVRVMTINDSLNETDFLFEENGYVRCYAFKMAWQDTFYILPDSTYHVKLDSLEIGDTWNSFIDEEPTLAVVVDTATVSVPAGTFFSYIIEEHHQSSPDSVIITCYYSFDVGWVKIDYYDTYTLDDYLLSGGTGYYPLYVGNWWRYGNYASVDPTFTPIPYSFNLQQNYPNPFNHKTTISFSLFKPSRVELSILDIKGQKVKTLVNKNIQRGHHEIFWNGKNESGKPVSSGIYFYKMETENYSEMKKAILMK